jgi:hypothetical protein
MSNSNFSAETVLQQLGGRKFIAMTGAKHFTKGKNFIGFKIPRGNNKIRYIKIELNSMDTYDMKFMTLSGKIIKKEDGIYSDQLQEIFTENTGLYTHL